MLLDYHREVKAELANLRQEKVDSLIGAEADKHDLFKGHINALDIALDIIDEVLTRFSGDETDGAAIAHMAEAKKVRTGTYYRGGRA